MPTLLMPVELELRTESQPVSRFTGRRVHFIGIGGCGMSGLARMLLDAGALVTGSDTKPSGVTRDLEERGVVISYTQVGSLLTADVDLVVRTAAIAETNTEYQAAKTMGLRQIKYAQLLGQVMAERFGIAVCGTHGKSTTTAMISYALLHCGADPSFVIGGTVRQLGGGSRSGAGDAFVVEACEYDRSFHNLRPRVAVMTNIEADHLDCYPGGIPEIVESFRMFAAKVPTDGLIVANADDSNVRKALAECRAPVEWLRLDLGQREAARQTGGFIQDAGGPPVPRWVVRVTGVSMGCYSGDVLREGQTVAQLSLSVAGVHNLFNAAAAVAACAAYGVDPRRAAEALGSFAGVDRRMTEVGRCNGATVVDDYGHHPTEIRTTLLALRERYRPLRLLCVFQPHQHSRTRFLLEDFAESFAHADQTIVPDIYFVRDSEAERQRVSSADLVRKIRQHGREALHLSGFGDIIAYLREHARPGDLVVTMGAGNVWEIARAVAGEPA